jgi:polysaccharide export outer membrane protein
MKKTALLVALGAALCAAGCATTRRDPPADVAKSQLHAMNDGLRKLAVQPTPGNDAYVIDPPDVLAIYVKDNPELSEKNVTVSPDGTISRPLVGVVRVGGRTVAQVADDLKGRYSKYVREAEVNVSVMDHRSKWIYVNGEVAKPGRYPYTGSDSVVNALAQAGFLTRRASPNGIHVARGNPNDPELYPVRLKDIIVDDDSRTNWLLSPEDIVYVPPSFISRVGYAIEELLFPFAAPIAVYGTYDDIKDDE